MGEERPYLIREDGAQFLWTAELAKAHPNWKAATREEVQELQKQHAAEAAIRQQKHEAASVAERERIQAEMDAEAANIAERQRVQAEMEAEAAIAKERAREAEAIDLTPRPELKAESQPEPAEAQPEIPQMVTIADIEGMTDKEQLIACGLKCFNVQMDKRWSPEHMRDTLLGLLQDA